MSVVMAMALSLDMARARTESQFVIHLLPVERQPADQDLGRETARSVVSGLGGTPRLAVATV